MTDREVRRFIVALLVLVGLMVFAYGSIHDSLRADLEHLESCLSRSTYQVCEKP